MLNGRQAFKKEPLTLNESRSPGFTLIELILTVAIIGALATIALPKFADMIIRSKEAALRGSLGSLRSALSIYYADNEGVVPIVQFPGDQTLLVLRPKYTDDIPTISIPTQRQHPASARQRCDPLDVSWWDWWSLALNDFVSWGYHTDMRAKIYIACTHKDSTGKVWSSQ